MQIESVTTRRGGAELAGEPRDREDLHVPPGL